MDDVVSPDNEEEESTLAGINRLMPLLAGLDQRGLILTLAAFADEALEGLLRAFLLPTRSTEVLLKGFNAPLGTLSSRIRAAYSMGLITEEQFEDLERMRKIRNEFSHAWLPVSFEDQKISDLIAGLSYSNVDDEWPETLKIKVMSSLSFLLVEIQVAANKIEKDGHRAKLVGNRLVAGVSGDLDEQLAKCEERFAALSGDLKSAAGEKRLFLLHVRKRWLDKLLLAWGAAPAERKGDVLKMYERYKAEFGDQ